ncbi:hypothetical protein BDR05DRAFT_957885 [Suillus weaverae]|nr:hypothetical protein BDR05DRAFT_957885 [Suillus weaverae]
MKYPKVIREVRRTPLSQALVLVHVEQCISKRHSWLRRSGKIVPGLPGVRSATPGLGSTRSPVV